MSGKERAENERVLGGLSVGQWKGLIQYEFSTNVEIQVGVNNWQQYGLEQQINLIDNVYTEIERSQPGQAKDAMTSSERKELCVLIEKAISAGL